MVSPALTPEAAALKDEGNKLYADKDYDKALDAYKRALELCPGNAVLHSNMAATYLELKDWESALQQANSCIRADPSFVKGYGRKVAAQLGMIRPGDADRTLVAALALHPGNAYLEEELRRVREDDGNQQPVRSRDGSDHAVRSMQHRTGETMGPESMPNDTFRAALIGDLEAFERHFKQEDLLERATEAREPLTIIIVAGAQRTRGPGATSHTSCNSDAERGTQHSRIMEKVIAAGARVDAKDGAGWTALHHALAHHPCMDLAKQLIEAGADVNAQDRFGTYALVSAIMCSELPSIKLLLEHGAKCDLKDNDGMDALKICRYNATIEGLVMAAHQHGVRPGQVGACDHCGKAGATAKCAGCGVATYCSRPCQKAAWRTHKASCASGSDQTWRVPVLPITQSIVVASTSSMLTSAMAATASRGVAARGAFANPASSSITVTPKLSRDMLREAAAKTGKANATKLKIQAVNVRNKQEAEALRQMGHNPDALLCYNEDRSLVCHLDGGSGPGAELTQLIRTKGVRNLKGHFAIYFDEQCLGPNGETKEVVVMKSMLPPQPW